MKEKNGNQEKIYPSEGLRNAWDDLNDAIKVKMT